MCGNEYRATLEHVVPGAFDDAVADADVFFMAEMPAVQQWTFGAGDSRRVHQPVLDVVGTATASRFREGSELVRSWFPHAEHYSLPAAGHLLMVENPTAMAGRLRDFFYRHPICSV